MIRLATCLVLLAVVLSASPRTQTAPPRARLSAEEASRTFEHAVTLLESRGAAAAAAREFEAVANGADRPLAARALVFLGECYERLGDPRARDAYQRVVGEFADQSSAASSARERLAALPVPRSSVDTTLRLRRFWTGTPLAGAEIGTVSLDGRSLALVDAQGRVTMQDLRTARLGARRQLGGPLDAFPCAVREVVVAPDASAVVYACHAQDQTVDLRWASLRDRSADERVLYRVRDGNAVEPLEWRRAGELLARLTRRDRTCDLVLVPIATAGGSPRTVVTMRAVPAYASLSPDGRWVTYDGPDSGTPPRRDVLIVPASGGAPRVVVGGPSDDLMPTWTADGRQLAWVSDRSSTSGLWVQTFQDGQLTGAPRLAAPDLGRVAQPLGLTTAGAYVYFRQTGLVDVYVVDLDETGRPIGPPSVEGTRYVGATMFSTWASDGARLAYRVELGASRVHAIGIRDAAGTGERIVTPAMTWIDMPRYSPDGSRLLVRGIGTTGGYGFFLIDSETGVTAPLKIVPLMEEDTLGPGQWDASGNAVVFASGRVFHRIDVATRQESVLFTLPEGTWLLGLPDPGFSVSPADGSVVYVQMANGLTSLVVRKPDGTSRELLRSAPKERFGGVTWGRHGRTVFFSRMATDVALTDEQRWPAVWSLDLTTGDARSLGIAMPRLRGLAASPDGRRLAFTSGSPSREPWILEHFLVSAPQLPARPRGDRQP